MRHLRILSRLAFIGLTLAVLTGCSKGGDGTPLQLQIIQASKAAITSKRAVKTPEPTRAVLDGVQGGLLEVTLERRDQRAYLYIEALRRDSGPGQVVIWRTGDNVSLMMRNGVLFGTRGLGGDILSGRVQVTGDIAGPSSGGEKSFDIRVHDNKSRHLTMRCEVANIGPQTIEIIGHTHATRHIRETCEGGQAGDGTNSPGQVINDYWIDTGAHLVRQSRQWAGPEVGYLFIRRVN